MTDAQHAAATVVAVSPHLDDVVISCGGTVANATAQARVVVATVFSGGRPSGRQPTPFERTLADRAGGAATAAERCAEDVRAAAIIGAEVNHIGIPDCIFRRTDGRARITSDADLFSEPGSGDDEVLDVATARLRALFDELRPSLVLVPLGLGGHLDHRLARQAAEEAGRRYESGYYEDLPYAAWQQDAPADLPQGMQPHVVDVDAVWPAKLLAVSQYRSQLRLLWPPPDDWREELATYATRIGGGRRAERVWARRSPSVDGAMDIISS